MSKNKARLCFGILQVLRGTDELSYQFLRLIIRLSWEDVLTLRRYIFHSPWEAGLELCWLCPGCVYRCMVPCGCLRDLNLNLQAYFFFNKSLFLKLRFTTIYHNCLTHLRVRVPITSTRVIWLGGIQICSRLDKLYGELLHIAINTLEVCSLPSLFRFEFQRFWCRSSC